MDVLIAETVSSLIYGIAWAGIVICFDFCMSKGNILNWYYYFVRKNLPIWLFKPLVGCPICIGFWFGFLMLFFPINFFIFLGISQFILNYKYGS